jgi:hypothetical protein
MGAPVTSLPSGPAQRSWDGDFVGVLIVVGVVAFMFVSYLAIDWLKTRRETRKLALKRKRACEAWQQEVEELRQRECPPEER